MFNYFRKIRIKLQMSPMPSFAIREMLEMSFDSVHYCFWTRSILVHIYKSVEKKLEVKNTTFT